MRSVFNTMKEYLKVGTITASFGIKGEMKVYPHTGEPERFKKLKKVFISEGGSYKEYEIESAKMALPLVIIKFRGIDTPEEIRNFRQKDIYVKREDATPLEEGEYYFADIIGMNVVDDEGTHRGKITDIIQTGANDVYEVTQDEGGSFLIPAIRECVLNIDTASNLMTIHIMEGLLD